jgi:hypothetical protein
MLAGRLASGALACAIALAAAVAIAGCGPEEEAHREGLALELEGVTYNVFITRQLNLEDVEDRGYAKLPPAPPGSTYYGVFLEACNVSEEVLETAADFRVVDTQENVFEPVDLEPDNAFAYRPQALEPEECLPETGSLASQGPTGGALLVFEIPLESAENRPLELEIFDGFDLEAGQPHELVFELDI